MSPSRQPGEGNGETGRSHLGAPGVTWEHSGRCGVILLEDFAAWSRGTEVRLPEGSFLGEGAEAIAMVTNGWGEKGTCTRGQETKNMQGDTPIATCPPRAMGILR